MLQKSCLLIVGSLCCSALLKLLHESVGSGGGCKFTELVMKCNWKVIRILPSRANDLDLDQILFDVHNFLVVRNSSAVLNVLSCFISSGEVEL